MNNEEKEDLRHAVLESLAVRHPASVPLRGVRGGVKRITGTEYADWDLESALEFLKGQGWASFVQDDMGATKWWQITAAGLLKYERG